MRDSALFIMDDPDGAGTRGMTPTGGNTEVR
jgi:hypothetical protein